MAPPNKAWKQKHGAYINEQRDRYTSIYEQEPKRHSFHLDKRHFPLSLALYETFITQASGVYAQIFQDIFLVSIKRIGLQNVGIGNSEGEHVQPDCQAGYAYNYEETYRLGKEFYIINDDDDTYFEELTQEDIDNYISEAAGLKIEKFQTVKKVEYQLQSMAGILGNHEPGEYITEETTYEIAHKPQYNELEEEITNAEVPTLSMPSISLGVWHPDTGRQPAFYTTEYHIDRQYNKLINYEVSEEGRQTDKDYFWQDFPIVPTEIRQDICYFTDLVTTAQTREDDRDGEKPPTSVTALAEYNEGLSEIFEKLEEQVDNEKEMYKDLIIESFKGGRRINLNKLNELLDKVAKYKVPFSAKTDVIKMPRMIQRSQKELEDLGGDEPYFIDNPKWGLSFGFHLEGKEDQVTLFSSPKKYDPFDIYDPED